MREMRYGKGEIEHEKIKFPTAEWECESSKSLKSFHKVKSDHE